MSRAPTVVAVAALLVLAGCSGAGGGNQAASGGQIGLAAGGAQDVNNFRDNVREGYLPLSSDLTSEGLFYDYYFETGKTAPCEQLFCPTYSTAVTRDPLSNETERYVTVGLNSGIDADDFERKQLNLVVVVDTSGSMDSPFSEYYYDENGTRVETEGTRKMTAAVEAVRSMTDQLTDEDRLGVVAYDDDARTVAPLERVGERDMGQFRERLGSLSAGGGTNLAVGMDRAESMVDEYATGTDSEYATRVVYVTDAMPNVGQTAEDGLQGRLSEHASRGIHTTFVGVGVDFNTRLVESISAVRGANYYSVHSADQFDERMDEGFSYMVTPLVYDLELSVAAENYEIARVYGTPEDAATNGTVMETATLFASRTEDGKTKGGVILLRLDGEGSGQLRVTASYENGDGEAFETTRTVSLGERDPDHFDNSGIRKAVLLSRYADLMRSWVRYERAAAAGMEPTTAAEGVSAPPDRDLGEWERRSTDLTVSPAYRDRIERFRAYFEREAAALGDEDLQRERELMATILAANESTTTASALSP